MEGWVFEWVVSEEANLSDHNTIEYKLLFQPPGSGGQMAHHELGGIPQTLSKGAMASPARSLDTGSFGGGGGTVGIGSHVSASAGDMASEATTAPLVDEGSYRGMAQGAGGKECIWADSD